MTFHAQSSAPRPDVPNSVLGKAFSILGMFDGESDTLRLIDLSRRSGISKPSVYRLAQELVELGMLERVGSAYRLGLRAFALGQRVHGASLLRHTARPILVDVVAATRSTAHLAVLDRARTYYLEKLGGTRGVHALSNAGSRLPLTCTATGKLFLAMAPNAAELLELTLSQGMPRLTQFSCDDPVKLTRELSEIRETRLAREYEEAMVGFKSYAVPVCDLAGDVIAALSLTVAADHNDVRNLVRHARGAAAGIGRQYARQASRLSNSDDTGLRLTDRR